MSLSRTIRSETCAAYRRLLGVVHTVTRDCPLHQTEGLTRYVAARFIDAAEHNRRRYLKLREETLLQGHRKNRRQQLQQQQQLKALDAKFERFIAKELQKVRQLSEEILLAPGNRALTSILQVLSAGVGNTHYQQTMEQNYVQYCRFESQRVERDEVDEMATSERQNRIMQHALIPYGERLLFIHRLGSTSDGGEERRHNTLTPWQMTEAIVGTRSGVTAHHMSHGKEDVVLEVDETYNKQIVYVRCEPYDWGREVERVEIMEAEEVRGTVFHAEYLSVALRLCDALQAETPLHAYRATVVVGHGVGGAVAFCMALLLHARGFDVKNCVTFGAPKAVQQTLARYVHAINPVRVVLEGDPLIDLPVTGAEGDSFVHYGEILMMASAAQPKQQEADEVEEGGQNNAGDTTASDPLTAEALDDLLAPDASPPQQMTNVEGEKNLKAAQQEAITDEEDMDEDMSEMLQMAALRYAAGFLPEHYIEHFTDTTVPLTYAEGDEVWDEGDYAQMRRETLRQFHVPGSQQWREDIKSPL
ncbi:hypothetical protein DQ04_03401030 [Trypanosoma grayi]|uniref:hypothetical protein n=1 Tax=Trypanosoma grayi TaxID=71804 RepID=UPI0004F4447C|nr:hypothetical protein DQ04_03401030 [Trypanosoma grayi]KEG10696.1 hypothetical protein DQ04_03401030 [Trypanosoma grayi]